MTADLKSISRRPERLMPWQGIPGDPSRTIGVINPCYGSSHVIYGLDLQRYTHRTLPTASLRRLDRGSTYHQFTPLVVDWRLPLVHTWNAIPLNRNFVVSFELELPRYLGRVTDKQIKRGMAMLASDRCRGILALSDFAFNDASRRFARHGFDGLVDKMQVFRGAVPDPGTSTGDAGATPRGEGDQTRPLSAVVIGTRLFHKGAVHAIRAFERLRASGVEVTLTLIGDFERESHVFRQSDLDTADEWRARAEALPWVRFLGPMPNDQVFAALKAHDLCIYTSLDESLGWLPIEAAMLSVPVISTAVCALPELVRHNETGWLIPVPLRDDGRWAGLETNEAARGDFLADADQRIVDGIEACLQAVHRDRSLLATWGAAARRLAVRNYGMATASAKLDAIYDGMLAGS